MALEKLIDDPQGPGQIMGYGKYEEFTIKTRARLILVDVGIYRSKEAREATNADGSQRYEPVAVERYGITDQGAFGPDGPIEGAPAYGAYQAADIADPQGTGARIYGFLKAFAPRWIGAEDA